VCSRAPGAWVRGDPAPTEPGSLLCPPSEAPLQGAPGRGAGGLGPSPRQLHPVLHSALPAAASPHSPRHEELCPREPFPALLPTGL
jgi:hypothetical protein